MSIRHRTRTGRSEPWPLAQHVSTGANLVLLGAVLTAVAVLAVLLA